MQELYGTEANTFAELGGVVPFKSEDGGVIFLSHKHDKMYALDLITGRQAVPVISLIE